MPDADGVDRKRRMAADEKRSLSTLIVGLGSAGQRHLRNLLTLGVTDIRLHRTGRATLSNKGLEGFPVFGNLNEALEHRPAEPGPRALVDPDQMMKVVNNLIQNALNYTPEGGRVVVSTSTQEAEGRGWATVTVADTGGAPVADALVILPLAAEP